MTLPSPRRWTDAEVLDRASGTLAKLALGACDGQKHGNPMYEKSEFVGYTTRRNVEEWIRTALTPAPEAEPGFQRGFTLKVVCAETWEKIVADEGDDAAAEALLMKKYEEILSDEPWKPTPEMIDRAVAALASFDPESLWVLYVQAAWPNHVQTPGSDKWNEVEARGGHHETVDNPFLL